MRLLTVVLLLLGLVVADVFAQRLCTSADYGYQYSQCRIDGTRDLLWYVLPGVNCSGGAQPPQSVFNLPCDVGCGDGLYLPPGTTVCEPCPMGTFSTGGGIDITYWPPTGPLPATIGIWSTFCQDSYLNTVLNCSGWIGGGTVIRSGPIINSQTSVLQLQTQLIMDGHITFYYRADGEIYYDGIEFYVDGNMVLYKVSYTAGFYAFTWDLTAGYHTLQWWYYKDYSVSRGEDAAFLSSVEIAGLVYSDSSCEECPVGTFAGSLASHLCTPCPVNTYASNTSTIQCSSCAPSQYSYTGASSCTTRPPCGPNDWTYIYGACSAGQRTGVAQYLQPQICDTSSFSLPAPITKACPTCPAGTGPDGNGNCNYCAAGTYSATGAACLPCQGGASAERVVEVVAFDSWPASSDTYCLGDCATTGWRLRDTFMDSGIGHGGNEALVFSLNLTTESSGYIYFTYSAYCPIGCTFSFTDPYSYLSWSLCTAEFPCVVTNQQTTVYISGAGMHSFTWTFSEFLYLPLGARNNSVSISKIQITNTLSGGAISCTPCANGTYSDAATSLCDPCPLGQTSTPDHTGCAACPANTFSEAAGSNCYPCLPQTTANQAHTDCIDTCSFTINGEVYDINPLATNGPVGPAANGGAYSYYFNLCSRGGFNYYCHDFEGNPLETHVCQYDIYYYGGYNLGWISGYYPLPASMNATKGFRVHYDLGDPACGSANPTNPGVDYPRSTEVYMICDPNAGFGQITGESPLESPICHYSFYWHSLYACPVCTAAEFSYYYTPCIGGMNQKIYYWNTPKVCHNGVALPNTTTQSCSNVAVQCGVGSYLGADGRTCVNCQPGTYSLGGGLDITWPIGTSTNLGNGFITQCDSGACTPFTSDDGVTIHSNLGDASLIVNFTFLVQGNLYFEIIVDSTGTGEFEFFMDGIEYLEYYFSDYSEEEIEFGGIPPGNHQFIWRFENAIRYDYPLLQYQGVTIGEMIVQGIAYNDESCTPCPAGTFLANASGQIECDLCPANTYSTLGSAACTPCANYTYSLPGAGACTATRACTPADYMVVYTACSASGTRVSTYVQVEPVVCFGGYTPPGLGQTVPCAPCPPSTYFSQGACVGCTNGGYYNPQTGCTHGPAGYLPQHVGYFFVDNSSTTMPSDFMTSCTGNCGTPGWRIRNGYVDSGFHGNNTINSLLMLSVSTATPGSVTFTYTSYSTSVLSGLQFSVDGSIAQIPVPSSASASVTVTYPLVIGYHELYWNYHQEGASGLATLSNIIVVGMQDGIGTLSTLYPCPAGQYSSDPTQPQCNICAAGYYSTPASTSCTPCPVNTFNTQQGMGSCVPCGQGSYTKSNASTDCITGCIYNIGSQTYNLTTLGNASVFNAGSMNSYYKIDVCSVFPDDFIFPRACIGAHVCQYYFDGVKLDLGRNLRIVVNNVSTDTPFSIYFENGESEECSNTTAGTTTIVNFACNPTSGESTPQFLSKSADLCTYQFYWENYAACPVCTDSDYQIVTGVCSGSHRQISKTRINNCNGPLSIAQPSTSCSATEIPSGAIAGIVVVFGAVVGVSGVTLWRNRVMSRRYANLMEESRSNNVRL